MANYGVMRDHDEAVREARIKTAHRPRHETVDDLVRAVEANDYDHTDALSLVRIVREYLGPVGRP